MLRSSTCRWSWVGAVTLRPTHPPRKRPALGAVLVILSGWLRTTRCRLSGSALTWGTMTFVVAARGAPLQSGSVRACDSHRAHWGPRHTGTSASCCPPSRSRACRPFIGPLHHSDMRAPGHWPEHVPLMAACCSAASGSGRGRKVRVDVSPRAAVAAPSPMGPPYARLGNSAVPASRMLAQTRTEIPWKSPASTRTEQERF